MKIEKIIMSEKNMSKSLSALAGITLAVTVPIAFNASSDNNTAESKASESIEKTEGSSEMSKDSKVAITHKQNTTAAGNKKDSKSSETFAC